ncbi:interferon alpha-inducible protein 27-like protein 2A [Pseudonaja textilis]|uniref:interferon alpha-inducible protein 27-like protein 2A n=1 Tax=Pseudonaja textilis TaxID=8673 RepID=UPI000EA97A6A|nr:interferon alpha-inducible protein 27-like protein 2A [Pseudonaja textilis]
MVSVHRTPRVLSPSTRISTCFSKDKLLLFLLLLRGVGKGFADHERTLGLKRSFKQVTNRLRQLQSINRNMGLLLAAVLGVGGVVGAPLALSAVGFTAAGIAAGTLAAKMMSAAAIANGGGVAAGSLVALAQAAGAAGLSVAANAGIATTGAVVGLLV